MADDDKDTPQPAETVFTPDPQPPAPNAGFSRFSNDDELPAPVVGGASASSSDIGSLMLPSYAQGQAAISAIIPDAEQRLQSDARIDALMSRRTANDANDMRRARDAMQWDINNIPQPWNADKERAERIRSPWEAFASPAVGFALIASAFSKQPAISAMNATAAAINAARANDEEGYKAAYTAWKDNTNLAVKRFELENRVFDANSHLFDTDVQQWKNQATANALRFNNEAQLHFLKAGMYDKVFELQGKQADATQKMIDARDHVEVTEQRRQVLQEASKDVDIALPPKGKETYLPNLLAKQMLRDQLGTKFGTEEWLTYKFAIDFMKENKRVPNAQEQAQFSVKASEATMKAKDRLQQAETSRKNLAAEDAKKEERMEKARHDRVTEEIAAGKSGRLNPTQEAARNSVDSALDDVNQALTIMRRDPGVATKYGQFIRQGINTAKYWMGENYDPDAELFAHKIQSLHALLPAIEKTGKALKGPYMDLAKSIGALEQLATPAGVESSLMDLQTKLTGFQARLGSTALPSGATTGTPLVTAPGGAPKTAVLWPGKAQATAGKWYVNNDGGRFFYGEDGKGYSEQEMQGRQ
jgi:hypothetical protein